METSDLPPLQSEIFQAPQATNYKNHILNSILKKLAAMLIFWFEKTLYFLRHNKREI